MNLDELERRMHEAFRAHTDMDEWRNAVLELNAALRINAPELIATARRMEWIEKNVLCIDTASDPDVWFADGSGGFKVASGRTLAAAIDAAMQEQKR